LYFWGVFRALQPLDTIRAIAERVAQARGL